MEEDEDIVLSRRTWERAAQPIQQDGFREGFEEGYQASFQDGFDEGFSRGLKRGFEMGFVNGALRSDKELGTGKIQLPSYDCAHRGKCAICPPTGDGPITKEQTAESSSKFESVDEVLEKEDRDVFLEENFESVNRVLRACDK